MKNLEATTTNETSMNQSEPETQTHPNSEALESGQESAPQPPRLMMFTSNAGGICTGDSCEIVVKDN